MSESVKTKDDLLGAYLLGLDAEIPNFQRSYEWGADQIDVFLEDLKSELINGFDPDSRYFFGPIIVTKEHNRDVKQIIDGQQRLTTTTIFLAALRDTLDKFELRKADALKYHITQKLIGERGDYENYRLRQIGEIGEYFEEEIQRFDSTPKDLKKQIFTGPRSKGKGKINNIIRAYNRILEFLEEELSGFESDKEKFDKLELIFNVFTKQFFIVEISALNRTDAFQIFQTINARGLDLTASDLIKSDFFGNAGKYTEKVIDRWEQIQSILGDLNTSDFIRYVWNSSYGFTQNRGLYRAVSKEIKSSDDINEFISLLLKLAAPYAEVHGDNTVNHLGDSNVSKKIKNLFEELGALNFRIYYPLYLSLINKDVSEQDILRVLNSVVSVLIRNKIMAKGTNWLEKKFSTIARSITSGMKIDTKFVDNILVELDKLKVPDSTLQAALKSYEFEDDIRLVRFILRSIENEAQKEKEFISTDNKRVHVEHIMPQTPTSLEEWGIEEDESLHEKYLWKLGNLTLWLGKLNSSVKNATFDKKISKYSNSDVELTRDIVNYSSWDLTKIESRTNDLVKRFMEIY